MSDIKELLHDYCDSIGLDLRTDYSGRNMYGKTCYGIVCIDPLNVLVNLCDTIRDEELGNCTDLLGRVYIDNMGMEHILYFLGVSDD